MGFKEIPGQARNEGIKKLPHSELDSESQKVK